jgi:hypothetical protein
MSKWSAAHEEQKLIELNPAEVNITFITWQQSSLELLGLLRANFAGSGFKEYNLCT